MDQINQPAQTVDEIIHAAVYGLAVKVAMAAAIAQLPILGTPVLKKLFEMLLTWIADLIYVPLSRMGVNFAIHLETKAELDQYMLAEQALRIAHLKGDQNELQKASEQFDVALENLVKFDGIVSK